MDVQIGLENAGDSAPEGTKEGCADKASPPGQTKDNGAVESSESAQSILPRRTNIEKAGLESKTNGETGQDQRRCSSDLLADADRWEVETAHQNLFEAVFPGIGDDSFESLAVAVEKA